jgi:hypothetical protein
VLISFTKALQGSPFRKHRYFIIMKMLIQRTTNADHRSEECVEDTNSQRYKMRRRADRIWKMRNRAARVDSVDPTLSRTALRITEEI